MLVDLKRVDFTDKGATIEINLNSDDKGTKRLVNIISGFCEMLNKPIMVSPNDVEVKNFVK